MKEIPPSAVLFCCLVALAGCAAPKDDAAGVEPPFSPATPPATVAEWAESSRQAVRRVVRAFDLTELADDAVVRTGRLVSYPTDGQPVVDLVWHDDGGSTRMRSDGNIVYVEHPEGGVSYSPWSEAGAVLFSEAGGKLLGAALDPSSFAAYGAGLTEDEESGAVRLEAGLPSGGGWTAVISKSSFLPRSVSFQAASEAVTLRLTLEPVAEVEPLPAAELRLEPEGGATASRFYAGPAPGDPAPNVRFELSDGTSTSVAELRGSVVVVDFWATWCAPCRPAMKKLDRLYREHRDAGLRVYGLRLFDSGDATAYLDGLGLSYPIGDGGPFAEPYAVGTYGLPTLYVIDREGRIARLLVGFSQETEAALVEAVDSALGGSR